MKTRHFSIVIAAVCAQHLTWALLPDSKPTAPEWLVALTLDSIGIPHRPAYAALALLALAGMFVPAQGRGLALALVAPQQVALWVAMAGSLWCVAHQRYADGYGSPWHFILKDQAGNILWALAHTGAALRGLRWRQRQS